MLRSLIAVTVAAVLSAPAPAQNDSRFGPMFRWIPPDVNLFVAADLNAIYNSPLATKERWASTAPLNSFSPVIQFLLLGARVNPVTFQDMAEYGVAYVNTPITMEQLAAREGGARDTIADADAVLSPRNAYFVSVAPFTIGMIFPALRQDAAKWVRFGRANAQPQFSPQIQSGISSIVRNTQFMLVMDLADTIRAETIRPRLNDVKSLKGQNLDAAAKVIASVLSVRLDLAVTDSINGALTITFGHDTAPIAPVAKAFLQEVLARHGAGIDEMENWAAEAKGSVVTLRGPLTEPSFRRLVSILAPPAPQLDQGQVESNNPLAAEIRLQASRVYFQSIQKLIDGLKNPPSRTRQNYQDFEMWYDRAGDAVGQLPTANVDPDLIKFGQLAENSLKAIAASARGENVQVQKAANSFQFGIMNTGMWGPWGGGGWHGRRGGWGGGGIFLDTNLADVNAAKQKAIDGGTQARNDIWANLMSEMDKIRQTMYDRFKTPF